MVRSSVILACALLLTVLFVPLMAPRVSAADVPVLLVQRNFLFHIDVNNNPNRNIAAALGDTIRLRVENHDAVTHTFTAPHFPQDTSPGTTQNLTENFLSVNLTAGSFFLWNHTVTTGDQGMWQFYCKPHSSGTYPLRSGMIGFFYLGTPTVRIVSPANQATVSTLGFRMTVEVQGFTMDAENVGLPNITGHGHLHFFVDDLYVGLSASPVFEIHGDQLGVNLTATTHRIRAELFTNNHFALSPRVFQEITVTAAPPSIQASVPPSVETGKPVTITWTVSGFVLDSEAFGGAPEVGRGHVHVLRVVGTNESYITATAGTNWTFTGLSAGTYTFKVELYNNDHSELPVDYSSTVTVTVTTPAAPPAAGIDATVFYGSVILLIVIIVALAAMLMRKGRAGMKTPPEQP